MERNPPLLSLVALYAKIEDDDNKKNSHSMFVVNTVLLPQLHYYWSRNMYNFEVIDTGMMITTTGNNNSSKVE